MRKNKNKFQTTTQQDATWKKFKDQTNALNKQRRGDRKQVVKRGK